MSKTHRWIAKVLLQGGRTIPDGFFYRTAFVSRFYARTVAHFRPSPGGEAGHWDAQRCACSGPTKTVSWCRSCAPEARRSACSQRPSTRSLTARSAAKRKGWRMIESDGKIKELSALFRYLQRIPALAALTWWHKVIQTSDGKVKGTKVRFL